MEEKDSLKFSRRDFLTQSAATLGTLAAGATISGAAMPAAPRKVLHIICYSHIDAAWLWPWRDSADEVLSTFRSALDRMKETPDLCYSQSSAAYYRWVQRVAPQMFEEIRARIREGRWEVVGGWPVEPDCNLPSTESFARHCLYGKAYCRSALGVDVNIGLNPDSFGHAAGLPTILASAGYQYYVFMRPQEQDMNLPLVFWWEGPDGSRVLTLRIWNTYDGKAALIPQAAQTLFTSGLDHAAFFLGVGDHGGAVTKEQIRQLLALRQDASLPELRFSTLHNFFAAVRSSPAFASLPVVKGGLQHHARGCYSADGSEKYLNRRAERSLGASEAICALTLADAGRAYDAKAFADSWWKVCFNQFHDLLAGTALYTDYEQARDGLGYACEVAETNKVEALQSLAMRVDMRGVKESAIFLFNPFPWPRKAYVEHAMAREFSEHNPITHLVAQDGTAVPVQWTYSASMAIFFPRLTAWVDLPPCGYKTFELRRGAAPAAPAFSNSFHIDPAQIGISSVTAEDGRQLLAGQAGLVVIADKSDTWAHGIDSFRDEIGRPKLIATKVIEEGPVTRLTRQFAEWGKSRIIIELREFAGLDFIEVHFIVDWNEHEQILKFEIPTAFAAPRVFAKVPGAVVQREIRGDEEPYHDWIALEGDLEGHTYNIGVLNSATYSYDCLNGLFRTILVRSAPYARHNPGTIAYNPADAWQDQGRQERRFWIVGASGPWQPLGLNRLADELQSPAEYVMCSAHTGTEPWEKSYLEIEPEGIDVLAFKRSERGNSFILRMQECTGQATTARLRSHLLGLEHQVAFAPWELKTLEIVPGQPSGHAELRPVSLLEV